MKALTPIFRVQSLYLLISVVVMAGMFVFPMLNFSIDSTTYSLDIFGLHGIGETQKNSVITTPIITHPLLALTIIYILLTISTIFFLKKVKEIRYANRTLQLRSIRLSMILNILIIAGIFYYSDSAEKIFGIQGDYYLGAILPLISILFLFMGNRAIKKDEKRIKATDRLR